MNAPKSVRLVTLPVRRSPGRTPFSKKSPARSSGGYQGGAFGEDQPAVRRRRRMILRRKTRSCHSLSIW